MPTITDTYRTYFPLLQRKCSRMLGDSSEAQDIAQETFMRLCQGGPWDQDVRTVTAWLYRTSTRLAIDRMRARTRQRTDIAGGRLDELPSDESAERSLDAQRAWQQLARDVPERELSVVLLTRLDGMSQEEVAEITGLHARTIRRILARFDAQRADIQPRSER
jgi:RNA polymerase sigma-70 factor (ECF subfamily)